MGHRRWSSQSKHCGVKVVLTLVNKFYWSIKGKLCPLHLTHHLGSCAASCAALREQWWSNPPPNSNPYMLDWGLNSGLPGRTLYRWTGGSCVLFQCQNHWFGHPLLLNASFSASLLSISNQSVYQYNHTKKLGVICTVAAGQLCGVGLRWEKWQSLTVTEAITLHLCKITVWKDELPFEMVMMSVNSISYWES